MDRTCTGKFTDIILRDYAIVASTLVKVLLLSRYNLFQMLSIDTLATIQRQSLKIKTESVESRALKTVLWDRYRHDVVQQTIGNRGLEPTLARCSSAPIFPSDHSVPRHIVDADFIGFSDLRPRKNSMLVESDSNLYLLTSRRSQASVKISARHSMSSGMQQIASQPVRGRRRGIKLGILSHISQVANAKQADRLIKQELSADEAKELVRTDMITFAAKILSEQERYDRTKLLGYASKTRSVKSEALQSAIQSRVFSPAFADDGLRKPTHGIHYPFSLIGFLRERVSPCSKECHFTGFRILGKCRAFGDAIHLFRSVCCFETECHPQNDISQFAVYKDDELTMLLENNHDGQKCPEKTDMSSTRMIVAPQYRPRTLSCGNEQRFACARVFHNTIPKTHPVSSIESLTMHVYQSFSTCQSAVRFAKTNADVFFDTTPLLIIPFYEWILFSDVQKLSANSTDLDQAIEFVTTRNALTAYGGESMQRSIQLSTCKGRRDAVEKVREATKCRKTALRPLYR